MGRWKGFSSLIFLTVTSGIEWCVRLIQSSVRSDIWPPIWWRLNASRGKYFFLRLFPRPKPSADVSRCRSRRSQGRSGGRAVPAGSRGCGGGAAPPAPGAPGGRCRCLGKRNPTIAYRNPLAASSFLSLICYCPLVEIGRPVAWLPKRCFLPFLIALGLSSWLYDVAILCTRILTYSFAIRFYSMQETNIWSAIDDWCGCCAWE